MPEQEKKSMFAGILNALSKETLVVLILLLLGAGGGATLTTFIRSLIGFEATEEIVKNTGKISASSDSLFYVMEQSIKDANNDRRIMGRAVIQNSVAIDTLNSQVTALKKQLARGAGSLEYQIQTVDKKLTAIDSLLRRLK